MVSTKKKLWIASALIGACALVVVHRMRDARAHAGEWSDGGSFVQSDDEPLVRRATWGEPREIAGELNTASDETRAAISSNGRYVVFAVGERGLDADLWIAELVGDEPRHARPLAELNTAADEVAPAFGLDALYFASDRPGGSGGLDLWRAPFVDGKCGAAERLAGDVNSGRDDTDPALSSVDGRLLFASNRRGSFDLYEATPRNAEFDVERLDALDTDAAEREPTLDPSGRIVLFASNRPGARGFDIFRAASSTKGWSSVEPVVEFNSAEDDRAPLFVGSGFEAWFARRGATHTFDLHRARSIELLRVPGLAWTWAEVSSIASLLVFALLVLLSERWAKFETIYKCFVISALVHLGILWWLQYVRVQDGVPPPHASDDAPLQIRVRAESRESIAARSERNGEFGPGDRRANDARTAERFAAGDAPLAENRAGSARLTDLSPGDVVLAAAPQRTANALAPAPSSASRETNVLDSEPRVARAVGESREFAVKPLDFDVVASSATSMGPERAPASSAFVEAGVGQTTHGPTSASRAFDVGPTSVLDAPPVARGGLERSATTNPVAEGLVLADTEAAPARGSKAPSAESSSKSSDDGLLSGLLDASPERTGDSNALERLSFDGTMSDTSSTPIRLSSSATTESAARKDEPRPAIDRPPWEGTPYANRAGVAKEHALRDNGGTLETERAVERGLAYLARIQNAKGYFGPLGIVDDKYGRIAVGKTALCTLAFLGAGHTHVSGTKYSANVARALAFLIAMQDDRSGHFGDSDAYGHGIATYALAEAFALTKDATLRASLEPAVQHILAKQSKKNDARFFGGWSYYYSDERTFDRWPRTSITAWQVMALESAHLAGIDVPDRAFVDAAAFLAAAHDDENDWYRYNHDPARLSSNYPTLPASTPAALFALSITGRDITTREFEGARAFIVTRAPKSFAFTGEDDFVRDGQGNPYFWYYGTLAMFRTGGGAWATWNEAMKRVLLPAQAQDGSWKPIDVYARYARDDDLDRGYTTALCVLSLEVYYRYYLPLLKAR